ncbi:MAG: hypothetical protein EA343_17495 [Nodularia sp. (in: Bacteria)]|nr:MAG: hypothetical protein EA343_17495 [Nodularia sp. (in: cyanobacteria)]
MSARFNWLFSQINLAILAAMKSLKIPPEYKLGITLIIKIDENIFNKLLNALTEINTFLDIYSLASEIHPKIEELAINDLQEILKTIRSIYSLNTEENLHYSEIIEGFRNAIIRDKEFSGVSDEELARFAERLNHLIAVDGSISISSKAIGLLNAYEHILLNSRIVIDVRPVFKTDNKQEIAGALVVHTLKIEYQDASGLKEFYVALDSNDLQKLQEQLSESLVQADAINSLLNQAGILHLDPNSSSK